MKRMKLWYKGYALNRQAEAFTIGTDPVLDLNLVPYDCQASLAHAKMLNRIGILSLRETRRLAKELRKVMALSREKAFVINNDEEDCHTAIENHLVRALGQTGEKIHTARSRNDQVLVALRLYIKDQLRQLEKSLRRLITTLKRADSNYRRVRMPGYTHGRKAMPYSVGKYFQAFRESLEDDVLLLRLAYHLNDQNPLGSAAGYGINLKIDRDVTTKLLKFRKKQNNELYCQNSRGKFEAITLFALSQIGQDLQRLANDLILFSSEEFGYFQLPAEFCTGSSIMPHKANPDVLEIVRAKSAVIDSYYFRITQIIKGLHSGYNRDVQLTKEPLMKGFAASLETIQIMNLVLAKLKVNESRCRGACGGEMDSVARVNALVQKGIAFREAYRLISRQTRK